MNKELLCKKELFSFSLVEEMNMHDACARLQVIGVVLCVICEIFCFYPTQEPTNRGNNPTIQLQGRN